MKLMKPLLILVLLTSGCASRYSLKPDRDESIHIDGHSAQVAESNECRVSAWSLENGYNDLLVEVRVKNKGKGPLEIQPGDFSLSGPAMKGDTLRAVEPQAYFAKLKADADNLEKRSKMKTYEGVDVITTTMPGTEKDENFRKVRKEFEADEEQKKKDILTAAELRKKEEALRPVLMKKPFAPSGAEVEGKILFPGPFPQKGKITLRMSNSKCDAALPFFLKN